MASTSNRYLTKTYTKNEFDSEERLQVLPDKRGIEGQQEGNPL